MKFILLVIIGFLSVSINADKQLSLQYTNVCEANGGYVRDPNNCKCFYQCDTNGNVWHLCCPDGQAHDEKTRVCIPENPMICDSYRSLVTLTERPSTDCYAPEGLFRHEDCSKFWHCSYNHLYEMSCPEGTLWNDVIKNCVLPQYSTCNSFVLNSLQTNNLNAILNDITLSNLRMQRQQIYDNEMIDYERGGSGEKYLEGKLNEHLSEAILNNKWLSSVTYITLDPTGKVVYGITKISKLSLEELDPNGNYSHPDFGPYFGFKPTLENDLAQRSMNETESMEDQDEDYDLTTQASIDSNSTTASTAIENNENTETIVDNNQFETSTKTEEPVTETSVGTDDTTTGSSDNSKDTTDGETNENNDSGDNEKIETSSNANTGSTEEESTEKTTNDVTESPESSTEGSSTKSDINLESEDEEKSTEPSASESSVIESTTDSEVVKEESDTNESNISSTEKTTDLDENMSSSTQTIESVTQTNEMSNYSNTEFNENT
jgi:hypothetical protein